MNEIWKDIEESNYSISSLGKVKNKTSGLILKTYIVHKGSLRVKLYINGKRKQYSIHRLVAKAFIPNPENKPEVDHINRNNKDNRVENLRWATRKENCQNRLLISKSIIKDILKLYDEGKSINEIYNSIKNLK